MLFNPVNLKTQVKTPNGSHCDVKSLAILKYGMVIENFQVTEEYRHKF